MRFMRLVAAALFVYPLANTSEAQTYTASVDTGCQVAVDAAPGDTAYRWQGECKDGRAEGPGLLTSSLAGLLRGEFKEGQPHDAAGFWPLSFKGGASAMT